MLAILNRSLLVGGPGTLPLGVLLPGIGLTAVLPPPNFGNSEPKRGTSPSLGSSTAGPGVSLLIGGGNFQVELDGVGVVTGTASSPRTAVSSLAHPPHSLLSTSSNPVRASGLNSSLLDTALEC